MLLILSGAPIPVWATVSCVVGVMCGTMAFAPEQTEGAQRFLGDQRCPPGRVWGAKVGFWIGVAACAAVATAVAMFPLAVMDWERFQSRGEESAMAYTENAFRTDTLLIQGCGTGTFLVWAAYGFSIPLVAAQAIRRTAGAVILALLVSATVLVVWLPSIIMGGVAAWELYAPPTILLITSRLAVWPWAADRLQSGRAAVRLFGLCLLAAVWIGGAFWYRVLQVPAVPEPFDVKQFVAGFPTPEQNRAGHLVRQACQDLQQPGRDVIHWSDLQATIGQGWPKVREGFQWAPALPFLQPFRDYRDLGRWLDRQFEQDWFKALRPITDLPVGVVDDARDLGAGTPLPGLSGGYQADALLRGRALQLRARRDYAGALDVLLIDLALARNLTNRSVPLEYLAGAAIEQQAVTGIQRWWADARDRHRPLLRKALDGLNRHDAERPLFADMVRADYLVYRKLLDLGATGGEKVQNPSVQARPLEIVLLHLALQAPWESVRTRRLIDSYFAEVLEHGTPDARPLPAGVSQQTALANPLVPAGLLREIVYTPDWYRESTGDLKCRRRLAAARLGLAVDLYQLETGKQPVTVEDLVPRYLPHLPLDPDTRAPLSLVDLEWPRPEPPNAGQGMTPGGH